MFLLGIYSMIMLFKVWCYRGFSISRREGTFWWQHNESQECPDSHYVFCSTWDFLATGTCDFISWLRRLFRTEDKLCQACDTRVWLWRSGDSACLPPMCQGFDSQLVVGSLLRSERFFSGYSVFPLSSKTNISKFQFDPGMHRHFWTSSCELLDIPWVNKLHFLPFFHPLANEAIWHFSVLLRREGLFFMLFWVFLKWMFS